MQPWRFLIESHAPTATLIVRLIVGVVFFLEGLQKFISPDELGVGRFLRIGIPAPEYTAPFVGVVEVGCGAMIIVGLLSRLATIPLIADMIVAIATTKVPIYAQDGFLKMAHEARVDYCMLLGSLFLLWMGSGPVSVDWLLSWRWRNRHTETEPRASMWTIHQYDKTKGVD